MRKTKLMISGAMAAVAAATLLPPGASAQTTLTGGTVECVGTDPGDANGSCNTIFRDRFELVGLTTAQLIETVKLSCPSFPDPPYQRFDGTGNFDPGNVISSVGYVTTAKINTPQTGSFGPLLADTINDQIGTDITQGEANGTQVTFQGSTWGNNPVVTIKQFDFSLRSQIIDLPGFDFVLFEKSSGGGGGQVATLVCDLKMWFLDGSIEYGIKDFVINHAVNSVTIGWVSGPSGMKSQARAGDACRAAGNNAPEDLVDTELKKPVHHLIAGYKVTPTDQVSPVNATGCGVDDGLPVLANHCDPTEVPGVPGPSGFTRPNSCNPDGESGGTPDQSVTITNGSGSCTSTFRGTAYNFC